MITNVNTRMSKLARCPDGSPGAVSLNKSRRRRKHCAATIYETQHQSRHRRQGQHDQRGMFHDSVWKQESPYPTMLYDSALPCFAMFSSSRQVVMHAGAHFHSSHHHSAQSTRCVSQVTHQPRHACRCIGHIRPAGNAYPSQPVFGTCTVQSRLRVTQLRLLLQQRRCVKGIPCRESV